MKKLGRYIVIPIILIVFFTILYLFYIEAKKNTIREFNNEQLLITHTASKGMSSLLENYKSNLSFLANQNSILKNDSLCKKMMKSFYETHKNIIQAVTKVDSKGSIYYTYPEDENAIGQDISNQEHVKEILRTQQTVISDVFMSVKGYYTIALHVPIFQNGQFDGSLAVLIPINKLGDLFLNELGFDKNGHAWLITDNQIEIYCRIKDHRGKSFLETTNHSESTIELWESIKNNGTGYGKSIHKDIQNTEINPDEELYVVYHRFPMGTTHWTILISYEEGKVYQALKQFRTKLLIIIFVLLIAVSYYFYSLVKVRNIIKEENKRRKAEYELRKAKEKAEENDQLKSAFLANISHEIRTPLNGIMGFTQLLDDPEFSEDEKKSFIGIIEKSGQKMLSTVNDIIDISKIESGQVDLILKEMNLEELLDFQVQFFKPEANSKGLSLNLIKSISSSQKYSIISDKEKLTAIISNLIKNAIKYTIEGFIEVKYGFSEEAFSITIKDSGIGIPKDKQESIFDRFMQVSTSEIDNREGSGIGLSIVKAYTDLLGGTISLDSEIGKGSRFILTFPIHQQSDLNE